MLRSYCFVLLSMLIGSTAHAQQEFSLFTSEKLWAANALNPAHFPQEKRFAIGLPVWTLEMGHSGGISYNDLLRRENNRIFLDPGVALDKLKDQNNLFFQQRVDVLSGGFRAGQWHWQGGYSLHTQAAATYPKQLAQVLWNGNAPFIGQTLNIGPALDVQSWQTLYVGAGRRFGLIEVGARLKFLSGFNTVRTVKGAQTATLFTDPDVYQLVVAANYEFQSSGFLTTDADSDFGFTPIINATHSFFRNTGVGLDAGMRLDLNPRLSLTASVLDVGAGIRWRDDQAGTYRSQGTYRYEGQTLKGASITQGTGNFNLKNPLDTLADIFQFKHTATSFRTSIPTRFYAGLTWQAADKWKFGATVFHQALPLQAATGVGINVRWQPARWFGAGLLYSYQNRTGSQLGTQLIFTPGPVQFFVLSDNLLGLLSPFASAHVQGQLGLSIVLPKKRKIDWGYPALLK